MLFFAVGALSQNAALTSSPRAATPVGAPPALAAPVETTGAWLNADPERPAGAAWSPLNAVVTPIGAAGTGAGPVLVEARVDGGRLASAAVALAPDALCRAAAVLRLSQGRGDAVRMTLANASGVVRFDAAWRGEALTIANVVAASGDMRLLDWRASRHDGDFIRLTATFRAGAAGAAALGLGPALPGAGAAVEVWGGGVAHDLPAYTIRDGGAGDALLWIDPAWAGWETALRVEATIDAGAPLRFEVGGHHVIAGLNAAPGEEIREHEIRIRAVYASAATDWSLS